MLAVTVTSIPEEVLIKAFRLVVDSHLRDGDPSRCLVTAWNLTHVCRSFRRIAKNCPHLWTTICRTDDRHRPVLTLALIDAALERSKNLPLNVHVCCYSQPNTACLNIQILFGIKRNLAQARQGQASLVLDALFQRAIPHASCWRSFTVNVLRQPPSNQSHEVTDIVVARALASRLHAPILERLCIIQETTDNALVSLKDDKTTLELCNGWSLPSLKLMEIANGNIPSNVNFDRLRAFAMHFNNINAYAVNSFLLKAPPMSSLSSLRISMACCLFRWQTWTEFVFPSVEHLEYSIIQVPRPEDGSLKSFFRAMVFPNVTHLKVAIDSDKVYLMNTSHDNILESVFVHPGHYPVLEAVSILVQPSDDPVRQHVGPNGPLVLDFPLHYLSSLQQLIFRSAVPLRLFENVQKDSDGIRRHPPLTSLNLDIPNLRSKDNAQWLKKLIFNLQGSQDWEAFDKMSISFRDGVTGRGNAVKASIPKGEVERWCDSFFSSSIVSVCYEIRKYESKYLLIHTAGILVFDATSRVKMMSERNRALDLLLFSGRSSLYLHF